MNNRREWFVLGALLILLFALESFATHRYLTSIVPGANDFYSRWAGARALLLEGRDPYGLDVTAEIQPVIGIDPSEVGRGGFNYPLHVIFLFWPLVYLSYDWTQAIWLVTLQWLAIGTVVGLVGWLRQRPSSRGIVALLLLVLTFYPITRSIFLGQFTLWVLFFLAMVLWALAQHHDGRAGALLAATSIKPQMVILIGPWLVLWAVGQRRWRFLGGLLGGGMALFTASLALFPRWPISFLEDIQRYDDFAGGRNPLQMVLDFLWPDAPGWIFYLAAGLLVILMLLSWWQGWRADDGRFQRTLHWTIVVGLIITFQTGTTNQVLLFIPLLVWVYEGLKRWGTTVTVTAVVILWSAMWALFLSTIDGNAENTILFLPLPFLSLLVLIGQEMGRRWGKRPSAISNEAL